MLDDDDDGDRGFKWGRAIVGGVLGFIFAWISVKMDGDGFWWLLVPFFIFAFGTGYKPSEWWFWERQWDDATREEKDAGAANADDEQGGHAR